MKKNKLRVIDFFCGAGGFSEGFRQQGFDIVMGVDNWGPAIESYNLNHGLNDSTNSVLDYWSDNSFDVKKINELPNTEIIIGSPSCVSFSMSNKAGKADKTEGIKLIESYLRVIAVKKHQKESCLMAWFMENVPRSKTYVKDKYSFYNLNLSKWATANNIKPTSIALKMSGKILNAGDCGAPQARKRYVIGEWIKTGKFLRPIITHSKHVRARDIRDRMPKVNYSGNKKWQDPNYPSIQISKNILTDHFYDTGLYKIEWEKAEYLKINHPFMGKMAFPENENRPSRTIMATRSGSTRESIIYKSEYNRKGNGEYRLPTIREAASLMGFPYVYQFVGSEYTKWKQVGNSVCPHLSASLAKATRKKMGLPEIQSDKIDFSAFRNNWKKVNNLNTFKKIKLDSPRRRKVHARFRRHPIKTGNITVDLMNYHPDKKNIVAKKWYVCVFAGTGEGYFYKVLQNKDLNIIKNILSKNFSEHRRFENLVNNNLYSNVDEWQYHFENDLMIKNDNNPLKVVKNLSKIIKEQKEHNEIININNGLVPKKSIPLAQLMAMYSLLNFIK